MLELQAELDAEEDKSSEGEEIVDEKVAQDKKRDIDGATDEDEEELKELEKLGMGVNENYKVKVKNKDSDEGNDDKFKIKKPKEPVFTEAERAE